MTDQERVIPWTQPGWFEQTSLWVHAELEGLGIKVTGPIDQPHSRPWSTVLRVPTIEGDIYFKAVSPLNPHEPAVLEAIGRWRPDCVPELLAFDADRGWLLMRDAGRMLRATIRPTRDTRPWFPVLPLYAELQIEMAGRLPELRPLRDAYLEPWTRYEPREDLLRALDLAGRLASINGALTWHRLVSRLEGLPREEYAEPVPALLQEFLDAETRASG